MNSQLKIIANTWLLLICAIGLLAQNETVETAFFKALDYRYVGPTRGGRVTAITGFPDQKASFLMGSTGGGIWKTEDYGISWKNISDRYFQSPSIGAIGVSPSNSKIIYVGTGSDGLRSNVIKGNGVYKSIDGGTKWDLVGLKNTGHIGAVEVHPDNPDIVYVAAIGQAFAPNPERGVYRSLDGGKTWDKILYISDSTGAVDLEFCPGNPNVIYAAMWQARRKPWTIISGGTEGGLYKSTDGGENWVKLSNGLPDSIIGKIDLAVSPADPNRLYALIEAPEGKGGLYRSDDLGASFKLQSTKKELLDRPFYYCNVDANPLNANTVYVSATGYYKSVNGGKKWTRQSTPHGDNHGVWINPSDSMLMIQANDGGANVSLNGGRSWSTQHNQSTAELYQVNVDDQFPYWLYAGQQDNSTIMVPSLPPYNSVSGEYGYWKAIGGCETGPAVPKPGNPNIVYSNCKGRFGVYNKATGQEMQYYVGASNIYGHNPKDLKFRFQRVAPIHVSPHNPDVVYHASQYLHKTLDDGKTWEIISPDLTAFTPETQVISGSPITRDITGEEFYSTIYAVQESPLQAGLIWVGANDGPIHVTRDGGKNWQKLTPKGLPPGGRVQCIEASPHQPGKAYAAIYRYLLGDWQPYIYKTDNYGKKWRRLTDGQNGIPADCPTRIVREDPNREGLLYAGTELGVFVSLDDGKHWQVFQQNLPITPITDIKVYRNDLVLSTMGRGFWILDDITPLHQFDKKSKKEKVVLFKPRDTYRMRYRGSQSASGPNYPSPGVIIDYYLAEDTGEDLRIDIFREGKPIRSFTNKNTGNQKENSDEPDMATGFYQPGADPTLNNKSGAHRFKWDLRHQGPWNNAKGRSNRSGPMVMPGVYQIKLQRGDQTIEHEFKVLPDPRLKESGVQQKDLIAQEELALKVRDLLSEARRLSEQVKNRQEENAKQENNNSEKQLLKEIKDALVTAQGRYQKPMLIDQISYLYRMLDQADQMPGKDAYDRFEELSNILSVLKPKLEKEVGSD